MAFSRITFGIVATLALAAIGTALYRASAGTDVAAFGNTIAELRDTRRLAAEWTRAAGQGEAPAPRSEDAAFDWRLLQPFGARWQERKGALERTAQGLDMPTPLANELALYINALDARAEGVRHFATGDQATPRTAAAWLQSTTKDNLAARASALIGDFAELVDTKQATAAWYKGGAVGAAVALVAAWIALLTAQPRAAALRVAATNNAGAHSGARSGGNARRELHSPAMAAPRPSARQHNGHSRAAADAPKSHAAETQRLREAMIAQLVAERLQAAAWRINATVAELQRVPAAAQLAARVDGEAGDVAALAASFGGLSRPNAQQAAVVDVAACLDEVVADTDVGGVPVAEVEVAPDLARTEVIAVPTAIRLMLANLLDNAALAVRLAHGRPARAGRVAISCAVHSHRVVVTVTDNGIGMPAPQRERAFLPFCSGWPSAAPNGGAGAFGMGCGLAIAAKLVDACAGTIALGSPPDGGTVAQIQLPLWQGKTPFAAITN